MKYKPLIRWYFLLGPLRWKSWGFAISKRLTFWPSVYRCPSFSCCDFLYFRVYWRFA